MLPLLKLKTIFAAQKAFCNISEWGGQVPALAHASGAHASEQSYYNWL